MRIVKDGVKLVNTSNGLTGFNFQDTIEITGEELNEIFHKLNRLNDWESHQVELGIDMILTPLSQYINTYMIEAGEGRDDN